MKELWMDLETTGLSAEENRITEIACYYCEDGVVIDEFHKYVHYDEYPENYEEIAVLTGLTIDHLSVYGVNEIDMYLDFICFLDKYISKYNKNDKLFIGGYNVKFDTDFIRQLFLRNDNKYYGSYFRTGTIDVMCLVSFVCCLKKIPIPENFKLKTIAEYFNIDLEAHSALNDIRATRQIYLKVIELLKDGIESYGCLMDGDRPAGSKKPLQDDLPFERR